MQTDAHIHMTDKYGKGYAMLAKLGYVHHEEVQTPIAVDLKCNKLGIATVCCVYVYVVCGIYIYMCVCVCVCVYICKCTHQLHST